VEDQVDGEKASGPLHSRQERLPHAVARATCVQVHSGLQVSTKKNKCSRDRSGAHRAVERAVAIATAAPRRRRAEEKTLEEEELRPVGGGRAIRYGAGLACFGMRRSSSTNTAGSQVCACSHAHYRRGGAPHEGERTPMHAEGEDTHAEGPLEAGEAGRSAAIS
jgi:hypothetical protein